MTLTTRRRRCPTTGRLVPIDWGPGGAERFKSLYPIVGNREMARLFGIGHQTVAEYASRWGLKKAPGGSDRAVPIGSRHIDRKGYWVEKVEHATSKKSKWVRLHQLMWTRVNGPVPKGHRLIFINGDNADCRLENLRLVTDREHLARYSIANYPTELRQTMTVLRKFRKAIDEKQDN